jgi:hypothetical protein
LAADTAESLAVTARVDHGAGGLAPVFPARLTALAPDRPDTNIASDADSVAIAVQAVLALSSAESLSYPVGASPAPAAAITVTDDAVAPSITAASDIRVRIPAGLPMTRDASIGALAVSGPAAGKVAAAPLYEDGARTLVLDVTADFAPNDRVVLAGAAFAGLAAPGSGRLELEIDAAGTVAALDDKTVTLFGPTGADPAAARVGTLWASPNPWTGRTTIRYALESDSVVRIDVYDVAGRRVRSLLHARMPAGSHGLQWDGADELGRSVAPGAYFVRLYAGSQVSPLKVVRLRP